MSSTAVLLRSALGTYVKVFVFSTQGTIPGAEDNLSRRMPVTELFAMRTSWA